MRSSAETAAADREKRLVALSSVVAAVALTSMKIVVGLATGSIGILAEAAHSALDLVAAAVTLAAVRASGRPADREHAYGHGKVENLSALFETALLLATCAWIAWESVERLFVRAAHVEVNGWSFAVMAVSIAVDVSRSRALQRAADRYGSQALEADALHFSTDVWSSSVVIGGLVCVVLAGRLGVPWLAQADAVAALGVAGISAWVSLRLGKRSVNELLDAAPPGLAEAVTRAALVAGVVDVRKVRLRRSGADIFADVTVAVAREASLERAHDTASAVEAAVSAVAPGADVVVHVEPVPAAEEGVLTRVRLCAARHGLGAHAIRRFDEAQESLDVHLEVPAALSVSAVDALVRRFEEDVHAAIPGLTRVCVHTEPVADAAEGRADVPERAVVDAVREVLATVAGAPAPEELRVLRLASGLRISFRWSIEGELPARAARALAVEAERRLREHVPRVARVLVHLTAAGR
jgi:cation diffusion facilitator family transporter